MTDRIERVHVDAWARARGVRLRALRDAPEAFWSTTEGEERLPVSVWRRRLARSDAATFLAVREGRDVGLAIGAPHHAHPADAGLYLGVGGTGGAWQRDRRPPGHGGHRLGAGGRPSADPAGRRRRQPARRRPLLAAGFTPTGAVSRFPTPRDHVVEHERVLELQVAPTGG